MYIGERPNSLQECFDRIQSAVRKLVDEYDAWAADYCVFNPPATEEQIAKLEQSCGAALPDEYKEFLRFANGARICGHSCTIYGTDMFGVCDRGFSFQGYELSLCVRTLLNSRCR